MDPNLTVWLARLGAGVVLVACVAWLFKKHDPPRVLLAVGGAIMSVASRWEDLRTYVSAKLPQAAMPWLLVIGALLLVVGLAWLICPRILDWFTAVGTNIGDQRFRWRCARAQDLARVRNFAKSFFGEGISPIVAMRRWHKRYNKIFWLLEVRSASLDAAPLRGYYCMIPVTSAAAEDLEGELLDGTTLQPEHIEPVTDRAAAVYIGAIAARGFFARGSVLNHLRGRLTELDGRGIPIYARPVSEDGLRLLVKDQFKPVDSTARPDELDRMYKKMT